MKRLLALTCILAMALIVPGCGGGGGSTSATGGGTNGRAAFTIVWPAKSASKAAKMGSVSGRVIPVGTELIEITILNGTTQVGAQSATPPSMGSSSVVTFQYLPLGKLTVQIDAYSTDFVSGTPTASATSTITITNGATASSTISLASTVTTLMANETSATVNATQETTVSANVLDSNGDTVPVGSGDLTYMSANNAIATVNTFGDVTGVKAGVVNITITELSSGKSVIIPVTVDPLVTISPQFPNSTTLGMTTQFSATIAGATAQTVNWSVQAGGGSINSSGLYTAPTTGGTYTITATDAANTSNTATAQITVTSGSGSVTVQ